MNASFEQLWRVLLCELRRYPRTLAAAFALINCAVIAVGLQWSQDFVSSTTILVEDKSIIQPLMSGAAVATSVTDRARIAREIIFNRKLAGQLLEHGGWLASNPSEIEQEKIYVDIKKRTKIMNVGTSLVKIEYRDGDSRRTFKVTQKLADLFIHESTSTQTQESGGAFEFIDNQVKEYHAKVVAAEDALKEFRARHPDAKPTTETQRASNIAALETAIERTRLEIKEAKIKEASLEKQLSGEVLIVASMTREAQHVARIAELQTQLDTLRLQYHETYPDIIRVRHQIEELRDLVASERKKGAAAAAALKSGESPVVDDTIKANPIYQRLRGELLETRTRIETLSARLAETEHALVLERDRDKRGRLPDDQIRELTRDYEVNRDIYQDLLRRRENARVSMNLDRERQGLSVRIHEPATPPTRPIGLRFGHFLLGGLILGLLVPPALLLGRHHLDGRIRLPSAISERLGIPLLAVVPHLPTPSEAVALRRNYLMSIGMIVVTMGLVVAAGTLRLAGLL